MPSLAPTVQSKWGRREPTPPPRPESALEPEPDPEFFPHSVEEAPRASRRPAQRRLAPSKYDLTADLERREPIGNLKQRAEDAAKATGLDLQSETREFSEAEDASDKNANEPVTSPEEQPKVIGLPTGEIELDAGPGYGRVLRTKSMADFAVDTDNFAALFGSEAQDETVATSLDKARKQLVPVRKGKKQLSERELRRREVQRRGSLRLHNVRRSLEVNGGNYSRFVTPLDVRLRDRLIAGASINYPRAILMVRRDVPFERKRQGVRVLESILLSKSAKKAKEEMKEKLNAELRAARRERRIARKAEMREKAQAEIERLAAEEKARARASKKAKARA